MGLGKLSRLLFGDSGNARLKSLSIHVKSMPKPKLTDHALEERLPGWGVLVLESHHSAEFAMDWREHSFLKLVYVLRGQGVIEIDEHIVHFSEGELIAVPPGLRNRITDAPDAASSLYVCCIDQTLFQFDPSILQRIRPGAVFGGPHLSNRVATQLRRMRHDQSNQPEHVSVSMVAAALRLVEWVVSQRHRPSGAKPSLETDQTIQPRDDREIVREYVQRLATEFYEATTIDEAAESLRMSRRSFTKLFSEVTGQTWLAYVRKLAINHAKHQLAQTNLSIASVAFEAGFNDLSTFYRQFKSQVGVSPKVYRKSIG